MNPFLQQTMISYIFENQLSIGRILVDHDQHCNSICMQYIFADSVLAVQCVLTVITKVGYLCVETSLSAAVTSLIITFIPIQI